MRVNIYIRQDNEHLWELLDNKSEWINEQLEKWFDEHANKN